jgi:hypothetical protein
VLVNDRFEVDERAVRHYGEVSVVNAMQDQDTHFQGQPNPGRFRLTLVVVRENDNLQIASAHLAGPISQGDTQGDAVDCHAIRRRRVLSGDVEVHFAETGEAT